MLVLNGYLIYGEMDGAVLSQAVDNGNIVLILGIYLYWNKNGFEWIKSPDYRAILHALQDVYRGLGENVFGI